MLYEVITGDQAVGEFQTQIRGDKAAEDDQKDDADNTKQKDPVFDGGGEVLAVAIKQGLV